MTVPGMIYPTQKAMLAGTPRDSAIQQMNNINERTLRLQEISKGGKIAIPQYHMLYTPQGGPGTAPNDLIAKNLAISTQGRANATYDHNATNMGGNRIKRTKRRRVRWHDLVQKKKRYRAKKDKTQKKRKKTRRNATKRW